MASNHTPEHVRAPRRARALITQKLTQELLASGAIAPAQLFDVPKIHHGPPVQDNPVPHSIMPTHSHAAALAQPGLSGVLIFGSHAHPGGGWLNGAKAQEEDVSLVSTWASQAALVPQFYGADSFGPDHVLMAKGLWLVDDQLTPLTPPRPVMFAGIAAPNQANPAVAKMDRDVLINALAQRLGVALRQWRAAGAQRVVLGAIGCGVFRWDPADSAAALRLAVNRVKWDKEIVLAMPDPALAKVFERILSAPPHPQNKKSMR